MSLLRRVPRRSLWRAGRRLTRATATDGPRSFSSSSSAGMDAFLEFEREMAIKRHQNSPRKPAARLERPVPPAEDECCKHDCPNCVLLVYQEKLLEYELSMRDRDSDEPPRKPDKPERKFEITFLDAEPTRSQREQLRANNDGLYRVAHNHIISEPHRTRDNYVRSVRHIDLHVRPEQQTQIPENASNIAVFVPNDKGIVDRVLAHLHIDADLLFTVEHVSTAADEALGPVPRPFDRIGSVRDALTWSFDLVSTPRSSVLRQLAAYASDEDEVAALMAPLASENIQAQRTGQSTTVADILDLFPSIHLDFSSFYQLAPPNAPRYYTVSSSRRLFPNSISITLGLRQLDTQPTPRCSTYLAELEPDVDEVRAGFFGSSFVYPHGDRRPILLISAGTGIAPFRAFLHDLEHEQEASTEANHRHAYLFYGCRHEDVDLVYADDLRRASARGYLDQLHVAYSANPEHGEPQYVQDLVREQAALVARHLAEDDGYIFICGSLQMGRAVKEAIIRALVEHGGAKSQISDDRQNDPETQAKALLASLMDRGRVVTELW